MKYLAIDEQAGLYLGLHEVSGDVLNGEASLLCSTFASHFRQVFDGLPSKVRVGLSAYWRKKPCAPFIELVAAMRSLRAMAEVTEQGYRITFNREAVSQMGPLALRSMIAHELGHVCFDVDGYYPESIGEEEELVDDLIETWPGGFSYAHIMDWATGNAPRRRNRTPEEVNQSRQPGGRYDRSRGKPQSGTHEGSAPLTLRPGPSGIVPAIPEAAASVEDDDNYSPLPPKKKPKSTKKRLKKLTAIVEDLAARSGHAFAQMSRDSQVAKVAQLRMHNALSLRKQAGD